MTAEAEVEAFQIVQFVAINRNAADEGDAPPMFKAICGLFEAGGDTIERKVSSGDLLPWLVQSPRGGQGVSDLADLAVAKRIFCAKEAAYKAQYPLTKTLFGFDRLDVTLSAENPAFDAQFTQDTERFKRGEKLPGRVVSVAGHLVSGMAIGQIDRKGA